MLKIAADKSHEKSALFSQKIFMKIFKNVVCYNFEWQMNDALMLSILGKIFSRQRFEIIFLFFPEKGFDISCKLFPWETVRQLRHFFFFFFFSY